MTSQANYFYFLLDSWRNKKTPTYKKPSTAEFIQDNIQKHFWDCNINVKPYTNIFNYKNFNYLCPDRTVNKHWSYNVKKKTQKVRYTE